MNAALAVTAVASALGGAAAEIPGGLLAVVPVIVWRTYWALRSPHPST